MLKHYKSHDLVFGEPYYSITDWKGYVVAVYPLLKPGQNGYSEKEVKKMIKSSRDKMIVFKNEFAMFGRRACSFFKQFPDRYIQVETYGFALGLITEILPYVVRIVILYDIPDRFLMPNAALERRKVIKKIKRYKKVGLVIRTKRPKTKYNDLRSIANDLKHLSIHRDWWEVPIKKYKSRLYKEAMK